MHRWFATVVLCFAGALTCSAQTQNSSLEPIHVAAGTVLTFHLQTRLKPGSGDADALDLLPAGTLLRVKMLDSIDSMVNPDGAEFHGSIVSSVISGDEVVVHPEAEVRGVFAVLRNSSHPDGFRNELLITGLTDGGKSYVLTASLGPSFLNNGLQNGPKSGAESGSQPAPNAIPATK